MKCDTVKTGEACRLAGDLLIGTDTYAGIYQVKKINTAYCIPSNNASKADGNLDRLGWTTLPSPSP